LQDPSSRRIPAKALDGVIPSVGNEQGTGGFVKHYRFWAAEEVADLFIGPLAGSIPDDRCIRP
jgi:hypothetical protein